MPLAACLESRSALHFCPVDLPSASEVFLLDFARKDVGWNPIPSIAVSVLEQNGRSDNPTVPD